MRTSLFLHVLPIVLILVAWAHYQVEPPWRIALVDSLQADLAQEILPIFEAEVEQQLGEAGGRVVIDRVPLEAGGAPDLPERLAGVDLVVSFGAVAAKRSRSAAGHAPVQHLLAFLPADVASDSTGRAPGALETALVAGSEQSAQTIAYSIARRLLASRAGPPLRIGALYRTATGGAGQAVSALLDPAAFVPLPLDLAGDLGAPVLAERIVAEAVAAAAREPAIDAFWLDLDPSLTSPAMVGGIIGRTGRPVLYASGRAAVAAGALLSVAIEPGDLAREAADRASRLLQGDDQGAAAADRARRLGFALNLATAEALGIVPPHDLLELSRGRLYR